MSFSAEEEVKFKILAINPSETKSLKTTISQPLPAEVNPDQDIIDKAGLDVKFNPEKKVYFLTKEIDLKPKETQTFEVKIKNVWQILPDDIEAAKKDLESQYKALQGTKFYDTGKLLFEKAMESLDRIGEEQSKALSIKQKVELYRAHVQQLSDIKSKALSLEAMRGLEAEKKTGIREAKFLITAENPSSEPKKMTVRSLLPGDVKPDDVLDKQDFGLLFDQSARAYVLEKVDQFDAKESKKYVITIRDIWVIPDEELAFLKRQTEKLMPLFSGTPFTKYAQEQGDAIQKMLGEVGQLQAEVASSMALEDRMRAHVLNAQKVEAVKKRLADLQQLLPEVPLKKDDAQILEKIKHLVKKLADVKDVVLVSMGFKPDAPATWWIILGIIAFLGVITTIFYFVWIGKLQQLEGKWKKKVMKAGKGDSGRATPSAEAPSTEPGAPKA